ncbi:hypothetical protein [Haladaptatus salinisoli]|uniref:hypothetical protein n=1 Tax=Haladaptatus salinisoli TaxID=2884876 RepID=UPI001D0AEA7B|nr:hypothetical protein [Haladaptatus salinisoli]
MAGLAVAGVGAQHVLAQDADVEMEVEEVNAEREYVIFKCVSGSANLAGYTVAFEYGNEDYDQRREIPSKAEHGGPEYRTIVEEGETYGVASGVKDVSDVNGIDLILEYESEVFNNDGNDVIALLDPDGNVVCTSKNSQPTTTEETTTTETTDDGDDGDETTTTTPTEDGDGGSTTTTTTTSDGGNSDGAGGGTTSTTDC